MSRINSKFKTILASILIACIVLNLFPLSLLALDEPYYSVSDEYEFSVTRVISSRWEDHANIDFTITNNGNATINNWYITTDLPYEVENIWNASIAETSDSYITISSAPQNQPIEPGCSVTFGITGYSEDDSLFDVESSFYLLNVEDVVIPTEKYQATTNVYSTTEERFSGAIAITNISSELLTIENVVLNSTSGLIINGNAAIEDETTLVVDSSSRNIYPSASIYINFEGTGEIPEVLDLRYTGLAFTLTEDEDNDGILDIDEFLYPEEPEVTPIPTITPTNTPEAEPTETPTVTPEEEPTPSTTPEVEEPTPTPEEVTPTPTPEITEEYLYQDDDADGLINGIELFIGYDVNSTDTDGDGILDAYEDFDLDGLTNEEECNLELNPISPDSDYDGINDYDEIYVYNSDPMNMDSDGDGIHDGDELLLGKNPTDSSDFGIAVNQTISREINNVEDPAITSVDITMDYVGNMETSVSVDDLYNIDTYSTAIYSRIGSPLGINSEFDFDSATVVIHYDDTMLGDTSEDRLGVLWFDEEHGVYIVQNQAVIDAENNTITLELEHFSTYVLVDIDDWWSAFDSQVNEETVSPETNHYYDYYFAIDLSQSMDIDSRLNALETVQMCVENMRSEDRITIFYFDTNYGIDVISLRGDNSAALNSMLLRLEKNLRSASLGGSYGSLQLPFQVTEAIINQRVTDVGNERELYILTNDSEWMHTTSIVTNMRNCMSQGGFEANFVMMAPDNEDIDGTFEFSRQYAQETGSDYYEYPRFRTMWEDDEDDTNDQIDFDSDNDGIYDSIEKRGMLLSNGTLISTNEYLYDSDGDGLSDSEERGPEYEISRDSDGKLTIKIDGVVVLSGVYYIDSSSPYYFLISYINHLPSANGRVSFYIPSSNPNDPDSDDDYYNDAVDPSPLFCDVITIGLGGGSFDLLGNDYNYNRIVINDGITNYGGNQHGIMRLQEEIEGTGVRTEYIVYTTPVDERTIYDNYPNENGAFLRDHGCGLIAYTDFRLYIENSNHSFDAETYADELETSLDDVSVTVVGVTYLDICNAIEDLDSLSVTTSYDTALSQSELTRRIECMLNNDIPVIASYSSIAGLGGEIHTFSLGHNGENYFVNGGISVFSGHWFVITGIIYDDISGTTLLRMAGGEDNQEYIYLSDFCEHMESNAWFSSIMTGVIYVR